MTAPTRRSFLAQVAAASAALPFTASLRGPRRAQPALPQKILILGGTGFLGPHFVRAALAHGHTVTLFNRGKTNPQLFPDLEKLQGDRDRGDLKALEGRSFDAVVDTSGYVPAHVAATAKLFADQCRHYTFVSSISVFDALGKRADTLDEQSPVSTVSDEDAAKVDAIRQSMPFYGPLKARCEAVAEAAMPGKVATVRPGLIVGPGDPTDRFTWWPVRIDRGGEVLAPGDREGRVQFIDVRDLADWMVHCLEQGVTGVYNATGFLGPVTMEQVLIGCQCASSQPSSLVWASEEFLQANQVGQWMEMPLWILRGGRSVVKNEKAVAKGLHFRPIADTIRDTLQWAKTERGGKPFANTGVKAEKEQALLAKWQERQSAAK